MDPTRTQDLVQPFFSSVSNSCVCALHLVFFSSRENELKHLTRYVISARFNLQSQWPTIIPIHLNDERRTHSVRVPGAGGGYIHDLPSRKPSWCHDRCVKVDHRSSTQPSALALNQGRQSLVTGGSSPGQHVGHWAGHPLTRVTQSISKKLPQIL